MARLITLIVLASCAGVEANTSEQQLFLGESVGQGNQLGAFADQATFSLWTLAPQKKIALECLGIVLAILLFAALGWMWRETPGSHFGPAKEVTEEEEEAAVPLLAEVVEAEKPSPVVAVPVAAPVVEESAPVQAETAVDYEEMVRGMLQRASDELGPKFQQGSEIQTMLQNKMETFADKAKALALNELNETCGSVAKIMEAEEFMMMLDWDSTIATTVPPPSVLLAGLLVPTNLAFSFLCHIIQIALVLLPVSIVTGYAIATDFNQPCPSIAGLKPWAVSTLVLALLIMFSRFAMMWRIFRAQMDLAAKTAEMKGKLQNAEEEASSGSIGFGNLKDLFICHSSTLQYAVVCEARCRMATAAHVVGAGSLLWCILTGYNMYLYFYYMFVPGVVAFHEAARGQSDFCGATTIACAAKFAVLVATLFFMVNIMTVISWAFDTTLNTDAITQKIAGAAKAFDRANMGIPVAQLLVKIFLLRGTSEVLCARLAITMSEKNTLAKEYADTEARLFALKDKVQSKEVLCQQMEAKINETNGGTLEAQAEALSSTGLDMNSLKQKGSELIDIAKANVKGVEEANTDEVEALVKRMEELVQQVTDSEEFKAAKAKAEAGVEQAKIAAAEAQEQAKVLAAQAEEQAKVLAAQAEEQAKVLAAQAEVAAAKAKEEAAKLAAQAEEQAKVLAVQAEEQAKAAAAKVEEEAAKAKAQAEKAAANLQEEAAKAKAQAEEQAKAAAKKLEEEGAKAKAQAEEQAKAAAAKVQEEAAKAAAQAEEQAKVAAAKVQEEGAKAAAQVEEQAKAAAAVAEEAVAQAKGKGKGKGKGRKK